MAGLRMPALFELYLNSRYSDFTITCGGQVFKVHRNIVCPESHFFSSVCKGNFQEQDAVELKEENPEAVARVIHYLYLGDYHTRDDKCTSDSHSASPRIHIRISAFARGENLINGWPGPGVKNEKAEQEYDKLLAVHLDVYRCASYLGIEPLRNYAAQRFLDLLSQPVSKRSFTDAVKMVYENIATEDAMLRTSTTEVCAFNYLIISESPDITSVIKQHEPAAWGVACKVAAAFQMRYNSDIRALALSADPLATHTCPDCNKDVRAGDVKMRDNGIEIEVAMHCAGEGCMGVYTISV